MKASLSLAFAVFCLFTISPLEFHFFSGIRELAIQANPSAKSKPQHYQAKKIKNRAEAVEIFEKGLIQIDSILEAPSVAGQPLETIHEITYSLEAAVEFWTKRKLGGPGLKKLASALEEIHLASERQQEEKVRALYPELKSTFSALRADVF